MHIEKKEDNLLNYIRLIRSENIGPIIFNQLISLYGSAAKSIEAIPELSVRGGRKKPIKIFSKDKALAEIENVRKFNADFLISCDDDYPDILREIKDFPPVLTYKGKKELLQKNNIAIVGSRNASANGCLFAFKIAQDLGKNNFNVASGLARGIDTSAHKGSLSNGSIGVIAGGINHIYPLENKSLFHKMYEENIVVSEMSFGTVPQGRNFPQRNRIISGLSLGTIIVEANEKSGSLITAKFALEQGREVFAVPGFPLDGRYSGTNNLIKQGANIIENIDDLLNVINPIMQTDLLNNVKDNNNTDNFISMDAVSDMELSYARKDIYNLLSSQPIAVDDLINISGYRAKIVLTIILELELAEKIKRHYGNKISLTSDIFIDS